MDLLEFFFSSLRHIHMYINIYVYTYVYVYIYICKPLNWSWMFFVLFIIICKHDGRIHVEVRGQLLVLNDLELWSYWLTIVFLQGRWGEGGQLSWHLCRKNSLELRRWPWSSHVTLGSSTKDFLQAASGHHGFPSPLESSCHWELCLFLLLFGRLQPLSGWKQPVRQIR